MRGKSEVIFDIKSEKFRYLLREEKGNRNIVDMDVLNKRLNNVKKSNIYSNAKMIAISLLAILTFAFISIRF